MMVFSRAFEEALTELAQETSKSLRQSRETDHVTYYLLNRWANSIEQLLDHMTGQHSPEDQSREWWTVKEGVLDEMREMLVKVKSDKT